jgi:hypothetical protein
VYTGGAPPVRTAFDTRSVIGCALYFIDAPLAGPADVGDVKLTDGLLGEFEQDAANSPPASITPSRRFLMDFTF